MRSTLRCSCRCPTEGTRTRDPSSGREKLCVSRWETPNHPQSQAGAEGSLITLPRTRPQPPNIQINWLCTPPEAHPAPCDEVHIEPYARHLGGGCGYSAWPADAGPGNSKSIASAPVRITRQSSCLLTVSGAGIRMSDMRLMNVWRSSGSPLLADPGSPAHWSECWAHVVSVCGHADAGREDEAVILPSRACGQPVLLRLRLLNPQRPDGDVLKLQVVAGGRAVSGSAAALRSLHLPVRQLGDLFEFSNKP
jgi:hypothetical protein